MFFVSDIPPSMPLHEARIMCSVEAGMRYGVPPDIVYAVSLNEGGKPGLRVNNTNGTQDLGLMQFNTAYLKTLRKHGIDEQDVLGRSCYSFHLAAWRIKSHIEEKGDNLYKKVAYYHSRTELFNERYQNRLLENIGLFDWKKAEVYRQIIEDKISLISMQRAKKTVKQIELEMPNTSTSNVLELKVDDTLKAIALLDNYEMVVIPEKKG